MESSIAILHPARQNYGIFLLVDFLLLGGVCIYLRLLRGSKYIYIYIYVYFYIFIFLPALARLWVLHSLARLVLSLFLPLFLSLSPSSLL